MTGVFIGGALGTAAVIFIIAAGLRERRLLNRLSDMLDRAVDGSFQESDYDESILSSLETRMARFLSASSVSGRKVKEERDRIKTLISDISHQTKTPVSNILLFTELLQEMELPKEGNLALQELKGQAHKLHFLIGALVKISRLESGIITVTPDYGSIDGMLERVYGQTRNRAVQKGVVLTWERCGLQACFDVKWTEEALYNLVDNAVKYTPAGGRVDLSARGYQMFVRIDVRDTGIGIAEGEQGQIFARFYRSEEGAETEGLGVGLFLAREIISMEGGYIRVESEKGVGSLFSVYLPCRQQ